MCHHGLHLLVVSSSTGHGPKGHPKHTTAKRRQRNRSRTSEARRAAGGRQPELPATQAPAQQLLEIDERSEESGRRPPAFRPSCAGASASEWRCRKVQGRSAKFRGGARNERSHGISCFGRHGKQSAT